MKSQPNGPNGNRPPSGDLDENRKPVARQRANRLGRTTSRRKAAKPPKKEALPSNLISSVDFHALGLRPNECRLSIIRRAASRNCRTLAAKQLKSPSSRTNLQLYRVAISTYRLMDPRKRTDHHQRAFVGRILPNALLSAGRTQFSAGIFSPPPVMEDALQSPPLSPTEHLDELPIDLTEETGEFFYDASDVSQISLAHGLELDNGIASALSSDDLLSPGIFHRSVRRIRSLKRRTVLSFATVATLLLITTGVFRFNNDRNDLVAPDAIAAQSIPLQLDPLRPDATQQEAAAPSISNSIVSNSDGSASQTPTADSADAALPASATIPTDSTDTVVQNESATELPGSKEMVTEASVPTEPVAPLLAASMPAQSTAPSTGPSDAIAKTPEESRSASTLDPAMIDDSVFSPEPFAEMADSATTIPQAAPITLQAIPAPADISDVFANLKQLIPELDQALTRERATDVLVSLNDYAAATQTTSPENWTARTVAAKIQWLSGSVEDVQKTLAPLCEVFDISMEKLLTDSFVQSVYLSEMSDAQLHRFDEGIRLYDFLLVGEAFDLAGSVQSELARSVDFLDEDFYRQELRDFRRASEQMQRMKSNATAMIDLPHGNELAALANQDTITPSQASVAGNYLCLMQRRWSKGLAWVAAGSDARLSTLAKQEQLLNSDSTAKERISVARRWLTASRSRSGRGADSMLAHSLSLFQSAKASANEVQQIELDSIVSEIEQSLPGYLTRPVAFDDQQPIKTSPPSDDEWPTDLDLPNENPVDTRTTQPTEGAVDRADETTDKVEESPAKSNDESPVAPSDSVLPNLEDNFDAADFDARRRISQSRYSRRHAVEIESPIDRREPYRPAMLGKVPPRSRFAF
ncbi:hypothetical protein [Planctomycetes bacterium K23_9]|uniref:Transmembrane protein n=1 Tax=Stieleria marina TaxID=1930275 RepID=A0A517NN60_9BACT|nr:hypothetical protein K239x_04890 [Planctomycetes bacterium K23_9]